jgi:hypothetical protein
MHLWELHSMQARFFVISSLITLSSCSHFPFKDFPIEINASIQGEIKGHKVFCEKKINLGNGKWEFFCGAGNDLEVKYRTQSLTDEKTEIEFMVGKKKDTYEKVIAKPILIVKKDQGPRQVITMTETTNLIVTAERIR